MKRFLCLLLTLALICTPVWAARTYSLSVTDREGGSLTLDRTEAAPGETVTGTVHSDEGYDVASVRVQTGGGYILAALEGTAFSFEMPSGDGTVIAEFFSTSVWDGAVDVSWYDPAQTEFVIGQPAQLAGLAALVNGLTDANTPDYRVKGDRSLIAAEAYPEVLLVGAGGGNVRDTVYCSRTDFAYKTVHLTADLDMGGVYDPASDSWSGPNYTPVGGKYSMDPAAVSGDSFVIDTRFNGVLDGGGHTVRNIYCQRYAAKGFPYSMAIGLVGYLGGSGDVSGISAAFSDGWQPAVRNVTVGPGYIYGRRMVGGVVGRVGETANGVCIENCGNRATVRNTDSKGVGGVLGTGWGAGVIRNCYNAGNVSTTFACPAGGICASNSGMNIVNCYNVGTIDSNGAVRGRGIGGHDAGRYQVRNCYYLDGCDDDPASGGWYVGSAARVSVNITALSAGEMQSAGFIDKLNANGAAFVADKDNLNGGYPVLWYEAEAGGGDYEVTGAPAEGGEVSWSGGERLPYGSVLQLSSQPEAGYTLKHYTVNGAAIPGDFWLLTENIEVGAVFSPMSEAALRLPESRDYALRVLRSGYKVTAAGTVWVDDEPLENGAALWEDNTLSVQASGWGDISPADRDMEFTDAFTYTASGAEALGNGKFRVLGGQDVTLSVVRGQQKKSWLTLADTGWYDGCGSYTLTTAAQLAGLSQLVNSGAQDFLGETVTLGADISLRNTDGSGGTRCWAGVGQDAERAFRGVFDGGGHTVTDMDAWSSGSYAALFGYLSGAVVKNLTVCGTAACDAASAYAAGIAACAEASTLESCVSRVTVTASGQIAGGVAAYISDGSTLKGCRNDGDVTAQSGVGGVVGVCYSDTDLIQNCENYGTVTATGSGSRGTGGIAGKLAGAVIDCGNLGAVMSADRYTGGLVGYASGRDSSRVENCVNAGAVTATSAQPSAAAGALVGYAQYLTMLGSHAAGDVTLTAAFTSSYGGGPVGRGGDTDILDSGIGGADREFHPAEYLPPVPESRDSYTVTFLAEGQTVAVETYAPGDTAVSEPPVPQKPGYTAFWDRYSLGDADITVRAVYRLRSVGLDGKLTESGSYAVDYAASGAVTIAPGLAVTLEGAGTDSPASITAGEGVTLTLRNVRLSGSGTLLTLAAGGRLVLEGENTLTGLSDQRGNLTPTVSLSGNITVTGSGSLHVSAQTGNAAILLTSGGALTLESGFLSVRKGELLGEEGGAIHAPEGEVAVSGGSLAVYTDSDNVHAIYAARLTVSSGSLLAVCAHTPACLAGGTVKLSGGLTRLTGGVPKSASTGGTYLDADAAEGLSGEGSFLPQTGGFHQIAPSSQQVLLNGQPAALDAYNLDGSNFFKLRDLAAALDSFSVDYDSELKAMLLRRGQCYTPVGGEGQRGADQSASAVPNEWRLYVDGALTPCQVYNIGGSNYFKLRDLAAALGFGVDYDAETRTISISA